MTKPAAAGQGTPAAKGTPPSQSTPAAPSTPAAKSAPAAKSTPPKAAPAKATPAKKVPPAASQTDKGRPRKTAAPTTSSTTSASSPAAPAKKGTSARPDQKRQIQPVGGPTGRPLTAADYEHTTKGSPASTAVIPAVKDRPDDARTSRPAETVQPGPGRRASLRLTHVEPWSVTRLAFAISVAMMIVAVVAVTIFWFVLDFVGVWDQINESFTTVLSDDTTAFNVTDYFGVGRVVGLTLVLSAVNVVLMTALATIGAHLYNLAAQLMGGVEVTLAEDK
ncbi:DUF3566 domain-containing protein [Aeromicrobium sp. CFBP 8757]|nr:DUF3566 domain-containing protein [Aeromicrobium sp. CFBP 8757]MBD8608371.1 DUF3566 domain-containing protein [Aeromicrobium sp. CFBP 8757]